MNRISNREFNIDASLLSFGVLLGAYRQDAFGDETPPESVKLTGVVRDFQEQHPDFENAPDRGFGLYSGNVAVLLGDDNKPVFTGQGNKITADYRDADGRPIARHLCNRRFEPSSSVDPVSEVVLRDSNDDDAFEIEFLSATLNDDGSSTWTYRVRELPGGKDLSHWNLKLDPTHQVLPGTTPGYDFGTDGSTGFHGIKWDVEDDFTEGEFTIVLNGHFAGANCPVAVLAKGGNSPDTGSLFAPTASVTTTGSPFDAGVQLVDSPTLGDDEGTSSYSSTGGVQSPDTFNQWFNDELGVNLSRPLTIDLQLQDDGNYVFDSDTDPTYQALGGFFPIEDDLFGNPGGSPDRNFHFTYELHSTFEYDANSEQFFRFTGDDDVWVFIDGKLAIDLGGVHATKDQWVDMSRLGLVHGQMYTMDLFFAERHRTESNFRIQTNIELEETPPTGMPAMTAAFD